MSWYVHPSKQLRDDELPPELVVTNRDGSIEQVYVPYNASAHLQAENAKLRELVRELWTYAEQELVCDETCPYGAVCDWRDCVFTRRMRELGVEVDE